MQIFRDAPAWKDADNPVGEKMARSWRVAKNGATQSWIRGRPPPAHLQARTPPEDRGPLYERYEKDWMAGVVRAAPSQDPKVLMKRWGAIIHPSFLHRARGKKPRPCVNYKPLLNSYVSAKKMRMETLKHIPDWGQKGMWMWQADDQKAFNSVQTGEMQKYMIIDLGPPPDTMGPHLPRYLVPLGLNFGYKLAPFLFYLASKPWLAHVRHEGIAATLYVDDSMGGHPDRLRALREYERAKELKTYYGLVLAPDKGSPSFEAAGLSPVTQQLLHLGLYVNTETDNGLFIVPEEKAHRVASLARHLIVTANSNKRWVQSTSLESYVGFLGSLYVAEEQAYHRCRNLQRAMTKAGVYSRRGKSRGRAIGVKLCKKCLGELKWALDFADNCTSRTMWRQPVTRVLASDASGSRRYAEVNGHYVPPQNECLYPTDPGWGGVLLPIEGRQLTLADQEQIFERVGEFEPMRWPNTRVCCGIWSRWEQEQMVSFLELRALRFTVQYFAKELQNTVFLGWQDNMNVVQIVKKLYSKSPMLHDELSLFMAELSALNARCILRWVESARNPSDYWSRVMYASDWSLTHEAFSWVCEALGARPTIDRFAQPHDHVVDRWNCPYEYPSSEATDAFTQSWKFEINWLNPPWALAAKCLQKLLLEPDAAAIILLPSFDGMYTPLLKQLSAKMVELPWKPEDCVVAGRLAQTVGKVPEPLRNPSWRLQAHLILPRRGRLSLPTIMESVGVSTSDNCEQPGAKSRSRGGERGSTSKPSAPGRTLPSSGHSSSQGRSADTTTRSVTGTPTVKRAATIRTRSATIRCSALVGGCAPGPPTKTSTAGHRGSTLTSMNSSGVAPSIPTGLRSTRRCTTESSSRALWRGCLRERSSQLRLGSRCRPLARPSLSPATPPCVLTTCSCTVACCKSFRRFLSCGQLRCGLFSREMSASLWLKAVATSSASAAPSSGDLNLSTLRIVARSTLLMPTLTRPWGGSPRQSCALKGRAGTGVASSRERASTRRTAPTYSPSGCEPLWAAKSICLRDASSRRTVYASWGHPLPRQPAVTSTGYGCGACGRHLRRCTSISRTTTATVNMQCRSSRSASRARVLSTGSRGGPAACGPRTWGRRVGNCSRRGVPGSGENPGASWCVAEPRGRQAGAEARPHSTASREPGLFGGVEGNYPSPNLDFGIALTKRRLGSSSLTATRTARTTALQLPTLPYVPLMATRGGPRAAPTPKATAPLPRAASHPAVILFVTAIFGADAAANGNSAECASGRDLAATRTGKMRVSLLDPTCQDERSRHPTPFKTTQAPRHSGESLKRRSKPRRFASDLIARWNGNVYLNLMRTRMRIRCQLRLTAGVSSTWSTDTRFSHFVTCK